MKRRTDTEVSSLGPKRTRSKRFFRRLAVGASALSMVAFTAALPSFFPHLWDRTFSWLERPALGRPGKTNALTTTLLAAQPRDIGGFQPSPNKCMRQLAHGIAMQIVARAPGSFGGCCYEQNPALRLEKGARIAIELELEHDDAVDLKFEDGEFGRPIHTGWLHRGPLPAGPRTIREGLVDDSLAPLDDDLLVTRVCFAFVGKDGPAANRLIIHAVQLTSSPSRSKP